MNTSDYVLITGGAGFLGSNLAHRLLSLGRTALIFDNLSGPGADLNLLWLRQEHEDGVKFQRADVRDRYALRSAVERATAVFHLAFEAESPASVIDPRRDFEVNTGGTLGLLEELRRLRQPPPLVFASSARVYGSLAHLALHPDLTRYVPLQHALQAKGIGENQPVDCSTPHSFSLAAADQCVLAFSRTYSMPAVVLRLGGRYGPRQSGNEDWGWISHFVRAAVNSQKITIYGDGRQVRDALFVDDAVDALVLAAEKAGQGLSGRVFNVGGGPAHNVSPLEMIDLIRELHGRRPEFEFADWRRGDPKYYVSDISSFREATGWSPRVEIRTGVRQLYLWTADFEGVALPPASFRTAV